VQRLAILFVCLLLQACSATTKGLGVSLWHSIVGDDAVQLTDDEVAKMRYASQYMRINNGPQLFVVLAYNENGQQKWVTQDRAMIVTQNGRIVKTSGLGDNLTQTSNLGNDPLAKVKQVVDGVSWTRQIAWTEHQQIRYATALSSITASGAENTWLNSGCATEAILIPREASSTDPASISNVKADFFSERVPVVIAIPVVESEGLLLCCNLKST